MSGDGIPGSGFALRGAEARSDLEGHFVGKHLWLSDEFSAPAERFCLRRNPQEGWGDTFCLRQVDHAGTCQFGFCPPVKDHDWKSLRASAPRSPQGDPKSVSLVAS